MRPHLSVSQLMMLARCPAQYEWRYIKGIRSPPGVQRTIGKGTHAGIEADLRSHMEWGRLLEAEEVAAAAADATRGEWEKEPPVRSEDDPDLGQAVDTAVSLARLYHTEVAPKVTPTAVEREFRLELDGCNFDVLGYIDVEETGRIRDSKTAAKAPSGDEAERSPQLSIYWLQAHLQGQDPEVALDFLVKGKKPRAITLSARRTPLDAQRMLAWIEAASRQIEAGAFPPTDPSNWWCSAKWCGYYDRCAFGARHAEVIPVTRLTARVRAAATP